MSNSLQHHGVKGQKWGVRRTPQQLGHDVPSGRRSITSNDIRNTKTINDEVGKITRTTENSRREKRKKKADKAVRKELSEMSDQELRDIVNRLNMEERYSQVMASRYADTGKSRVDKMLDKVGTAVTITSSALTIALAIKELSK